MDTFWYEGIQKVITRWGMTLTWQMLLWILNLFMLNIVFDKEYMNFPTSYSFSRTAAQGGQFASLTAASILNSHLKCDSLNYTQAYMFGT